MFVVLDGRLAALIAAAVRAKASSREAITALHEDGIQVVMLTGDAQVTASVVAEQLGIDRGEAEVLPFQKVEFVSRLRAEVHTVAMAGDGINDAPALVQVHLGVAMGTGTDVAMEGAGVTLVKGGLRGVIRARHLRRVTMLNIRQHLFFAFVYSSTCAP